MATLMIAVNKPKSWNRAYCAKKKLHFLNFEPDAVATANAAATTITATTNPITTTTADSAAAVAAITGGLLIIANIATADDPWYFNTDGTMRMPAARQMAKSQQVKPAVDAIISTGSINAQSALLCAVADHTSLSAV